MSSFTVYEMTYTKAAPEGANIELQPLCEAYCQRYVQIYNECFHEMRKALDVAPYDFYYDVRQIKPKMQDIFLLTENENIVGSVACYKNEIDDLIVAPAYRGMGYGKKLLLWAIRHIREYTDEPITLHVTKWNKNAVKLYTENGFTVTKTITITR